MAVSDGCLDGIIATRHDASQAGDADVFISAGASSNAFQKKPAESFDKPEA
jgi:hypothetical protein